MQRRARNTRVSECEGLNEEIIMEDWLKKKFVWRNVGVARGSADRLSDINWAVRYFRLYPQRLVYYRDAEKNSEPLGEIGVQSLVVVLDDINTISIYPQQGALRLYPDLGETCVERCYLRRCYEPKLLKEKKGTIFSLEAWVTVLKHHSYPRDGADLVVHINTNRTILWGTEVTESATHDEVAFLEVWQDDQDFLSFAFENYGEGHDVTTFSVWLRQPRNMPTLVRFAEEYCQGSARRQEKMKRILRDVGLDKSVYSFWRLLEWIRSGRCGLRVVIVFRSYDQSSIKAMFERCVEHGFGSSIKCAQNEPEVWTALHKVDDAWLAATPGECIQGFEQPSTESEKLSREHDAHATKFEELARKQFDAEKYHPVYIYTKQPALVTVERNGRMVQAYDRFEDLDPTAIYSIEKLPELFRNITFDGDFLRIMALQDNYNMYAKYNWRNGMPICAGPYVRPLQVVFDQSLFSNPNEAVATTCWATYDAFGNFTDGTRTSMMRLYSAEKQYRENEDTDDREQINVPLFYQTTLYSNTSYDTAASDPMYFIGRIAELIPSIQPNIPAGFQHQYVLDMHPIRAVNELQLSCALPVVWDPRASVSGDATQVPGVFIKAVQWNVLADILAVDLQLFEHGRPFPAGLLEDARGCLDKKNKWMSIEKQAKFFNARYSNDGALHVPKYWKLREPVNLISPVWTWDVLTNNEVLRRRFQRSVLGWEHRISLFIDNLLEQKPNVIFLQEVDRYRDFKKGLSRSDVNPMQYHGFHISSCNSRSKFISIGGLLEEKLVTQPGDSLRSVLQASVSRCIDFPDSEKKDALDKLLKKDRMRIAVLLESLFRDFADELTLLDVWADIRAALWENDAMQDKSLSDEEPTHGSRPRFVEDGLAIFIDDSIFEVDTDTLDRLRYYMTEREIYDDDKCKYYKNCAAYDRSVEPGQLYIDSKQHCIYFYFSSTPSAGVIVVPVIMKHEDCRAILFSTHLQSGANDNSERIRQHQVTEFSVQMEGICTLMERPVPLLGGMNANTDPRFRQCVQWIWSSSQQRYVETSSDITAAVNAFELLVQHGFKVLVPEDGVSTMKEPSILSDEVQSPRLALIDYILLQNQKDNADCRHEILSHSVSVNTTIRHMLPNVIEPSDHKGVVSWLEIRPKLYKKTPA